MEKAKILLTVCQEKGLTFGFAESCTGGMLSCKVSKLSGASQCFHGAIISYSNHVKTQCLGVRPETIAQFGTVSANTAQEMAKGALAALNVDFAAATTGVAGPSGGNSDTPVGCIYIGLATKSDIRAERFEFKGNRESIIEQASNKALELIVDAIHDKD